MGSPWGWQGRWPSLFPSARAAGWGTLKKLQVGPFVSLLGDLGDEGQYRIQKQMVFSKGRLVEKGARRRSWLVLWQCHPRVTQGHSSQQAVPRQVKLRGRVDHSFPYPDSYSPIVKTAFLPAFFTGS